MVWPVLMLVMAVVLAVGVGWVAYVGHARGEPAPLGGVVGIHRAEVGRHRPGGIGPVGCSVARLRERENAEDLPRYPTGRGGRS